MPKYSKSAIQHGVMWVVKFPHPYGYMPDLIWRLLRLLKFLEVGGS